MSSLQYSNIPPVSEDISGTLNVKYVSKLSANSSSIFLKALDQHCSKSVARKAPLMINNKHIPKINDVSKVLTAKTQGTG